MTNKPSKPTEKGASIEEAAQHSAGGLTGDERYEHIAGFKSAFDWQRNELQKAIDEQGIVVQINECFRHIKKQDFDNGEFEIITDESDMVQIRASNNGWFVSNAMNGYGHNNREDYKDVIVKFWYPSFPPILNQ